MSRCFDFLELIADQAERFGTRGFELVLRAFEIAPGLGYGRGIFYWIEKRQADRNADVELTHCLARFVVSLRLNIECRIGEPLAIRELDAEPFGFDPILSPLHIRSPADERPRGRERANRVVSAENPRRLRRLRPSLLVPGSDFFLKSELPAGA